MLNLNTLPSPLKEPLLTLQTALAQQGSDHEEQILKSCQTLDRLFAEYCKILNAGRAASYALQEYRSRHAVTESYGPAAPYSLESAPLNGHESALLQRLMGKYTHASIEEACTSLIALLRGLLCCASSAELLDMETLDTLNAQIFASPDSVKLAFEDLNFGPEQLAWLTSQLCLISHSPFKELVPEGYRELDDFLSHLICSVPSSLYLNLGFPTFTQAEVDAHSPLVEKIVALSGKGLTACLFLFLPCARYLLEETFPQYAQAQALKSGPKGPDLSSHPCSCVTPLTRRLQGLPPFAKGDPLSAGTAGPAGTREGGDNAAIGKL